MLNIDYAKMAHAVDLAPRLREADKLECYRLTGLPPEESLKACLLSSERSYALFADGKVEGLFGVSTDKDPETGIPWLLMSDIPVTVHKDEFVQKAPLALDMLALGFNRLWNIIDPENTVTARWLKRLGFILLDELKPMGVFGYKFRPFEWRRKYV